MAVFQDKILIRKNAAQNAMRTASGRFSGQYRKLE
jgi:hypothetical protein